METQGSFGETDVGFCLTVLKQSNEMWEKRALGWDLEREVDICGFYCPLHLRNIILSKAGLFPSWGRQIFVRHLVDNYKAPSRYQVTGNSAE